MWFLSYKSGKSLICWIYNKPSWDIHANQTILITANYYSCGGEINFFYPSSFFHVTYLSKQHKTDLQDKTTKLNYICMETTHIWASQRSYIHERLKKRKLKLHMAFWATERGKVPGASEARKVNGRMIRKQMFSN